MSLKVKKLLLSIVLVIFVILIASVGVHYLWNWNDIEYKNSMKRNKEHFIILAKEFESMYDEERDGILWIWFRMEDDDYILDLWSNTQNDAVIVGKSTRFEIDAIRGIFGQENWAKAIVTPQGVSFTPEGNDYAFVYTFDGKKPKYMNSEEERFSIQSQALGDNCYFVKSYD